MQITLSHDVLKKVSFLTGEAQGLDKMVAAPAKPPFDGSVVEFLNEVSKALMKSKAARTFSDVATFGFWIRKSSILKLKERFEKKDHDLRLGKGIAFHIAPSNVPVNFAYSLVMGLLTGNANVVRVPAKEFEQVTILAEAFREVLAKYEAMKPYVVLVRYARDKDINDLFSSFADMRIVWGGDRTITELRKSPLSPRAGELTFADRYSLAVIDSECYLHMDNKEKVAEDFYNDTFFTDQNACTSPRAVVWTGTAICEAKEEFWKYLHELVKRKYKYQSIQGVNKLTRSYLVAANEPGCRIVKHEDNLIVRVAVPYVTDTLMDYRDNSGYFYEYDCKDISEIGKLCDDKRCQTIAYIGDSKMFAPLFATGVKGIDRIVPVGKTMDFDLVWDGYEIPALLTRTIFIR